MGNTTRFTKLLGECRRQMNGAVAGSMRYYGADYGLNYGVSLPTVRELAVSEGKDHQFAKYLYQQQVREIKLCALHIAEPEQIATEEELSFWGSGIINSEVAEEAAFALFQHVEIVYKWLNSDKELLIYTALLSLAKGCSVEFTSFSKVLKDIAQRDSMLSASATITLLENYYRQQENRSAITELLSQLPQSKAAETIRSEMQWRCETY